MEFVVMLVIVLSNEQWYATTDCCLCHLMLTVV